MSGAFLVDWVGRRPLFIASGIGMLIGKRMDTFCVTITI